MPRCRRNRTDESIQHAEQARAAFESMGQPIDAARSVALMGEALAFQQHFVAAIDLMAPVYDELAGDPEAEGAVLALAEHLARAHTMRGQPAEAQRYADRALELAEARQDWERVVSLLGRHAVIWLLANRPTGALALLRAAVDLGRRHRLPRAMIIPLLNSACFLKNRDVAEARTACREALELALQVGARDRLGATAMNLAMTCWVSGDWDEVEALYAQHRDDLLDRSFDITTIQLVLTFIRAARDEEVDFQLVAPEFDAGNSAGAYLASVMEALVAEANGDVDGTAVLLARAVDTCHRAFGIDDDFAIVWPIAVEGVLAAGQGDEAERLLGFIADAPAGLVTPLAHAHLLRVRALVGIARGDDTAAIDADLEPRDAGVPGLRHALLPRTHAPRARPPDDGAR